MGARSGIGMKMLVMAMAGLIAAGAGGWFLLDAGMRPPVADWAAWEERHARERELHEVSLFSYVYPATGEGERPSVAVMLTVGVKGRGGLDGFCNAMPLLREAVLRVFDGSSRDIRSQGSLDRLSGPLRSALNGVVPGSPVQSVEARVLLDAGVGGAASYRTDRACREFVSS